MITIAVMIMIIMIVIVKKNNCDNKNSDNNHYKNYRDNHNCAAGDDVSKGHGHGSNTCVHTHIFNRIIMVWQLINVCVGADNWSSQTTPTGKTTPLSAAEQEWQSAADAWASSTTGNYI